MKLLNLRLQNFQGIKSAEFEFKGANATIYGDNATGKTTVFNALTWLLFDKASTGAKGFTPKTRTATGDAHNLTHSAAAEFENGSETISLEKRYEEVYKKKKGAPLAEFSGHTTSYIVNGVPVREKEYQAALDKICDSEIMKILAMPHYFSEGMTWDSRRQILLDVCGNVEDGEIIAAHPELADIKDILGNHTIDEYKAIAASKKRAINTELAQLPGRIDEVVRGMPEAPELQESEITAIIKDTEETLKELTDEYKRVVQGVTVSAELEEKLLAARAELKKATERHDRETERLYNEEANRSRAFTQEVNALNSEIWDCESRIRATTEKIKATEAARNDLIKEYSQVQAETFDTSKTICPVCGREFPTDKISEMIEAFNTRKSDRLAEINKRGKKTASKDAIKKLEAELSSLNSGRDELIGKRDEVTAAYEKHQQNAKGRVLFSDTKEYAVMSSKIALLEKQAAEELHDKQKPSERIEGEIKACRERIADLKGIAAEHEHIKKAKNRIAELQEREQELAKEYESIEGAVYLCDQFVKAKISMLTSVINGKFEHVSFRLFQEQINGGVKEDCEVLIPSPDGRMVPYSFANNAARINAGLEIISTLAEHWGLAMPVFVDNAESVTSLQFTDQIQVIRLFVSEADKTLRLEAEL